MIGFKSGLGGPKRVLLALALLFTFTALVHAQSPPISCFTGDMYGRDVMIALAALIMLMIIALAYMASKIASRPEWEAWAKTEAYQVMVSCILAASMILIADIACWVSWDFSAAGPATGNNAFQITEAFLQKHYESTVNTIYTLYQYRLLMEYMSSYYIMMATNPQFLVQRFPGLAAVSQNINTLITIFSILAGNIMVQKLIFQIIQQLAFSVVLPLGLVLRIFPFTRDAGSFLIAVAFGFYIVFPLLYVMEKEVVENLPDEERPSLNIPLVGGVPIFPLPGAWSFFLASFFLSPVMMFFESIKNLDFVLVATFFPALNITITSVFIKSLTKAIIHQTG